MTTSRRAEGSDGAYSRFFNPIMGIREDTVTGSAAGPLRWLLAFRGAQVASFAWISLDIKTPGTIASMCKWSESNDSEGAIPANLHSITFGPVSLVLGLRGGRPVLERYVFTSCPGRLKHFAMPRAVTVLENRKCNVRPIGPVSRPMEQRYISVNGLQGTNLHPPHGARIR